MIQLTTGENTLALTLLFTQITAQDARLTLTSEATSNAVANVALQAPNWDGRVLRGTLDINTGTHDPAAGEVELLAPAYPAGLYSVRITGPDGVLWGAGAAWLARGAGEPGSVDLQPYIDDRTYRAYEG